MKIAFCIVCFTLLLWKNSDAQILSSGASSIERDSLLQVFKGISCNDKNYINASSKLLNYIDNRTQILRIYYSIEFNVDKFNYSKNVINYLSFEKEHPVTWLISDENLERDSVFAVATQGIDNKNCYLLAPPSITFRENFFYKILKPILNKVDMKRSYVFYMSGSAKELLILTEKRKVYVIDRNKLIPFNEYYKARYTIKELRMLFR